MDIDGFIYNPVYCITVMSQASTPMNDARCNRVPPAVRRMAIAVEADSVSPPSEPSAYIHGHEWKLERPSVIRGSDIPEGFHIRAVSPEAKYVWIRRDG